MAVAVSLPRPVTVLIVDDSPIVRRVLRRILEGDPELRVVGEAATGREAVELARRLSPRVITIDVVMPEMNGIEAIELIMAESPTRILVITVESRLDGRELSFEALSRGALELIPKPAAWPALEGADALRGLVKRLADVPVVPHVLALQRDRRARSTRDERPALHTRRLELVVIGASTGGPRTICAILGGLPPALPVPIVLVQHLADGFAAGFVAWLASQTPLRVLEAQDGAALAPGTVFVTARGPHVTVTAKRTIELVDAPPRGGHRPSIDVLFESAARSFGALAAGVLLSGMGADGAAGLKLLADAGAFTLAQDEGTSAVFGMPKAAIDLGAARHVVGRDDIAAAIVQAVRGAAAAGGESKP